MKTSKSLRTSLRWWMALGILIPSASLTAQTIQNPSFEADNYTVFPGYASGNGGTITGWTTTTPARVGINPAASSPFANNGAIPNGTKAAFLQGGATGMSDLSTVITDLVPGTTYNVQFRVTARYNNVAWLRITTDAGSAPIDCEVSPVSSAVNATPYKFIAFEFTATDTSHQITLTNTRTTGDHTVVVDDFQITASNEHWSFEPWNDDSDSGFDSQYVYTHAYNLNTTAPATINGVRVIARETGTVGRFTINELGSSYTNFALSQVTGASATIAKDFRYNGANPGINLDNLKPNTEYVFTLYGVGFDAPTSGTPHRSSTFTSTLTTEKRTVNLNQYGQGKGLRVIYRYTTDANGSPVTISYPSHGTGTFHTSAFSNREANPSTPEPAWTAHAWNDDATSGISSNHHYTHAYNFGTTTNLNLNGVVFTGTPGANPTTSFYSSTLPAVYTNDLNNTITGFGADLSTSFIHGGFPEVQTLSGLTPGKEYVFTIYSTGWEAPGGRINALFGNPEDEPVFLDQSQFGANNGIRIEYRYTARVDGTVRIVTSAVDSLAPLHVCAISNREAEPLASTAPSITLQPVGTTQGRGISYTMRVGAIGSEGMTYQWLLNGDPVPGANGPILVFNSLADEHAGNYTVEITNDFGTATSDVVTVNVLDNAADDFSTGVGLDGQVLAAGSIDPHFTIIQNPDNPSSTVAYVQSNIPGSWTPNTAKSKWIGPRVDTASAAAGPGTGETDYYIYRTTVDLTGFDPNTVVIKGKWTSDNAGMNIRVNGVDTGITNTVPFAFGALSPFTIDISNAPGIVSGVNTIDFLVRNDTAGLTGLRVEDLQVIGVIPPNTPPYIARQPQGGNGLHNGTFTFAVSATGSDPVTYQWFKDNEPIPDATASFLTVDIDSLAAAGDYRVQVTNNVTSVDSEVVVLTVTNAVPLVVDDELSTDENVPLEISIALDMLANDSDPDGDTLELAGFSASSLHGGTVTLSGDHLIYTPAANFSGIDGFTYTISDGWGGTSLSGTVLINVIGGEVPAPGPLSLTRSLDGTTVSVSFMGAEGVTYTLQRSIILDGDWIDVDTADGSNIDPVQLTDSNPPQDRAFYRISYTR